MSQTPVQPLRARPLDLILTLTFAGFGLVAFTFDVTQAIEQDLLTSTNPLATPIVMYAEMADPMVVANPIHLQVMSGLSAMVFGPLHIMIVVMLTRGLDRFRVPALMAASMMVYANTLHTVVELIGPWPPSNLPMMLAVYAPYVLAPLALIWRLRHPQPFSAS